MQILSIDQFRAKLVDIAKYIDCRRGYRFGSMQEMPASRDFNYIPFDIVSQDDRTIPLDEIMKLLSQGTRVVILGDYGSGKSSTMREIFMRLSKASTRDRSNRFPILLNLRDHYGQVDATEALERHSKKIGFDSDSSLVRAWRAGYALIMLDGFDELAIPGWQGQPDKLKKLRRDSMSLVRDFVHDTPSDCGLIISGRRNYFDSEQEMREALGFNSNTREVLFATLQDFTEEQVQKYLQENGWYKSVPSWFPTRPLLLSYLIRQDLIGDVLGSSSDVPPAEGWDSLLTRVCEREAMLEVGIDGNTIRSLIERLASKARISSEGLGPLAADEIVKTFQEVCRYYPDDKASILLQRLPGLGVPNDEDGARNFIDLSLVDAARSGDVVKHILSPFEDLPISSDHWKAELGEIGLQMVLRECQNRSLKPSQISLAIRQAISRYESSVLASDLVRLAQDFAVEFSDQTSEMIVINDIIVQELEFDSEMPNLSRITYQNSYVRKLTLSPEIDFEMLPRFRDCLIVQIEGRTTERDLSPTVFHNCIFEDFSDTADTTNAVMDLDLPLSCRVMTVILRKLYVQSGAGRRTSALYRGLDHRSRQLVDPLLHILKQEDLVIESKMGSNTVWLPIRSRTARVRDILSAPYTSRDSLWELARRLDK